MWNLIIFGEQYGSYEDMSVLFRTTCTGGGTASASRTWGRPQSSSGRAPPLSLLFFWTGAQCFGSGLNSYGTGICLPYGSGSVFGIRFQIQVHKAVVKTTNEHKVLLSQIHHY